MRALAGILLLAGCTASSGPGSAASSPSLIVAVPASLRPEFDSIVAGFRTRHPDLTVSVVTATPSQVAEENLPVDLVAADSFDSMIGLIPRLIPGDRRDYAANPLCLVARAGAGDVRIRTLTVTPWVKKVGIADGRGDPTGAATEAALGRLGIYREVHDRLVYTGSEKEAIERLGRGELDVAFALATDVAQWNAKEGVAHLQLADRYVEDPRARLPIGIVQGTARISAARALVDEVLHGDGQKLFAQKGLLPPGLPALQ
jgi:ABC-type molybdate transport system substrate-binding protein